MAKYNYSRKGLKGLTPFPFLGEVKTRLKAIEAAPDTMPRSIYNANILAAKLHPAVQHVRIAEVVDHGGAKSFTLVPDVEKGTAEMAYFRASQYVSVALNIDGAAVNKPYTIRSGPKDALGSEDTSYTLTIKLTEPSYASKYILDTWKQGDAVDISGPLGDFYYQDLRDAKHVVAIAGGSGITPFYSMAAAIADGIEDFDMTILYGSRTAGGILLRDEIEAVAARSNGRVRVVHVLSHEEKEGYEHGFITAELIKKYAPADAEYSVFLCGPEGMYRFLKPEIEKLALPERLFRRKMIDVTKTLWELDGYPQQCRDKIFNLTVRQGDREYKLSASANETVLTAIERAGIKAPSRCRSGECGWCRSRMLEGSVFIPQENELRRWADKEYGYIHPCSSFPTSDIVLEVPGEFY